MRLVVISETWGVDLVDVAEDEETVFGRFRLHPEASHVPIDRRSSFGFRRVAVFPNLPPCSLVMPKVHMPVCCTARAGDSTLAVCIGQSEPVAYLLKYGLECASDLHVRLTLLFPTWTARSVTPPLIKMPKMMCKPVLPFPPPPPPSPPIPPPNPPPYLAMDETDCFLGGQAVFTVKPAKLPGRTWSVLVSLQRWSPGVQLTIDFIGEQLRQHPLRIVQMMPLSAVKEATCGASSGWGPNTGCAVVLSRDGGVSKSAILILVDDRLSRKSFLTPQAKALPPVARLLNRPLYQTPSFVSGDGDVPLGCDRAAAFTSAPVLYGRHGRGRVTR
eukprot:6200020-Pleurochrysis_carterae.AAC.1